jgi:hypothetical protein
MDKRRNSLEERVVREDGGEGKGEGEDEGEGKGEGEE